VKRAARLRARGHGRVLALAAALLLTGCLAPALGPEVPGEDAALRWVAPSRFAAPHGLGEVQAMLEGWALDHAEAVQLATLGESLEGQPLLAARITLGQAPGKLVAFLDGGHHPNEVEGIEQVLHLGEYLLANLGNRTVRSLLERSRGNARGVNLNRNYDLDWGNPGGSSLPALGGTGAPTGVVVAENPGTAPFSEPEARAVRDALAAASGRLAFYVTMHTQAHSVVVPWAAFEPPAEVPGHHQVVFDRVVAWVLEHTEYRAGRGRWGDLSTGAGYAASGTSYDWAYHAHQRPAFLFEQGCCSASDAPGENMAYLEDRTLDDWMRTGLPFLLYLLANAEALAAWEPPEHSPAPLLPTG
jgi:hypothetical protein